MTRNIITIEELHDLIKEVGIYQISFQDVKDRNFITEVSNIEIINFNISFELMEFISLEITNIIGGNKNQKLEVRRELLFNNNLKHKNLDRFILDANQDGTVSVYYEPYNKNKETEEFMSLVSYLKRQ